MRVSLITSDRMRSINIPDQATGNFWLTDYDENGKEVNLINIKEHNGSWHIVSNHDVSCILNGSYTAMIELKNYVFNTIQVLSSNEYMLVYTSPSCDKNFIEYYINPSEGSTITIGSSNCNINYKNLDLNQAKIVFENGRFIIYSLSNRGGVFINNFRVIEKSQLSLGDTIFINGLKFIFVREMNAYKLIFYNYENMLSINGLIESNANYSEDNFSEPSEDIDMKWYKEDDYFHKTPRFLSEVKEKEIKIDVPPAKQEPPDMPVILTIGPMLTMSMSSVVNMLVSVNNIKNNGGSIMSSLPTIVMAVAMLASTLLWPTITRKFQEKKRVKNEAERIRKYSEYIDSKRQEIALELVEQTTSLKHNFPSLFECKEIIMKKSNELWQKRISDEDFLKLSLGYGNYSMDLKISYPEEHFSMLEDELKEISDKLGREPKMLYNVPVAYSFLENRISSIIGNEIHVNEYFKKILLQMLTFHSYVDFKIVILTDNDKKNNWNHINNIPHCMTDDRQLRFFASTTEEYTFVCSYLEKIYNLRKEAKITNPHSCDKIYLIVTDSFKKIRNIDFINTLLDEKENIGINFLILNKNISTLPDQCKTFINVDFDRGNIEKNIINDKKQEFSIELARDINYNECYIKLSNIPIETKDNGAFKIPDKVGFLEMFDVGNIEQLNSLNRWKKNNPIQTLKTEVGYGKGDEIQYIDLHEKAHGPHGLVAGMTGSGKSEFIISYILSLAVNYHPYEVQFILIDYKGGGLAGAFENAASGKKLPHLVGVITNLDKSEIKRTISSIESELKRRQKLFNLARESSGESTVDIYKYQDLYRQGKVEEPVSHLFIISDEFAELKTQQPEFMEQLISTARIGRSLGVHLILATQKPSGVVDPQIWSNTRFRVCLRVQDKSDSNEVIKCPDAAFLKQTGRFYFQVGYNEVFTLGQAAWAGGKYIPSEKIKKPIDTSIEFIDNVGKVIKRVETKDIVNNLTSNNYGVELANIVNYLSDIANLQNIKTKPLWLDKIPSFINIHNVVNKYNYVTKPGELEIPIGEYDIPAEQRQNLLTINFTKGSNTLIYGATGTGKENFIITLLYSSMQYYTPEQVNYYIMDFGAEVLKVYSNSSYVGGIVTIEENERVKNLFKMISNIIENRKELFSNYGGDINSYNLKNSKKEPYIVVILNNYEAYQDTYSEYDDMLNTITRDCAKYGVYFTITCNTPNGLRFKLKQNFSQIFCLQQNNEDDYSTILGNVYKNYPAKLFGRGIIKKNGTVYEFQTAFVDEKENINDTIENMINDSKDKNSYVAKRIPILPKVVTQDDILEGIKNDLNVVIGVEKNELTLSSYNLEKELINIVTTNDYSILTSFVNSFIKQLKLKSNIKLMVANAENIVLGNDTKENLNLEENDFNKLFEQILNYQNECYKIYESNNYNANALSINKTILLIINGIDKFMSKLTSENKLKISEFFTKTKDLNIIRFVIVDELTNIKKVEFESWFKEGNNPNNGIWIGNGINDQFTIKITIRTPEVKENINDDFCFVVNKGKPELVKYVSEFNLKAQNEEVIDIIE